MDCNAFRSSARIYRGRSRRMQGPGRRWLFRKWKLNLEQRWPSLERAWMAEANLVFGCAIAVRNM